MIFTFQFLLSDEMPPTKKEKVTFTCTSDTKHALEAWSEREGRTLSNLVERIVLAALAEQEKQDPRD